MPITFPVSLANFFGGLAKVEVTIAPLEAVQFTETGGGEILRADYGPRTWAGTVNLPPSRTANADQIAAMIEILQQAGASFMVGPAPRRGPQSDPIGTALGAFDPGITALNVNNREISIGGLPNGYVLTRGDFLSFTYLTGPVRYALHRVITTATANGDGDIASLEVYPPLRPGVIVGADVKVLDPVCKAVIVPGSYAPGANVPAYSTGASFSWQQTLR